jgi:16S rRNA (adenine1518-N6/adenine1519-N6)-dimethyltransferase
MNFVVDPNTVRRIARLAGVGPGDRVVEIGAGLGSLTLALVETGASVTAVEVDRHLVGPLRAVVEPRGATVVEGDALRLDWGALLGDDAWALVANLPYNVATPLVADLLDGVPAIRTMLVMVQREVGERLAAGAGDEAYGAVSVKVAYWATARVAGRVPPTVFVPQPNVDSSLVAIERRAAPAVDPAVVGPDRLFRVVRAGFGQRRKMLRRSLAGVVEPLAVRASRHRAHRPARGARRRRLGSARRRAARRRPRWSGGGHVSGERQVVRAPAKLTVSLRVTGVRADGYHEIDAEMVTLDLADELELGPGDSLDVVGATGLAVPATTTTWFVGRSERSAARRPSASRSASPPAPASAAARRTPPPSSLGRLHGPRRRRRPSAPTSRSAWWVAVPGHRDRRGPRGPRAGRPALHAAHPAVRGATPAVYRAWDDLGGPTGDGPERPRGRSPRRRAPPRPLARRASRRNRLGAGPGRQRPRRGSSTASTPGTAGS